MKIAVLLLFAAVCCDAQFRWMEIAFTGSGCESCTESLSGRLKRIRGVENVSVDAGRGAIDIQLSAPNRVRLEQIRDLIEQDGSHVGRCKVRVQGEISSDNGRWLLRPASVDAEYELHAPPTIALRSGVWVVSGQIAQPRPTAADIVIEVTSIVTPRPIPR